MSERKGYQKYRSYSQLTTYLECGEQFRLKYIERLPETPAVWSLGGTAFHTCAEWMLLNKLDGTDPRAVVEAWADAWDDAHRQTLLKLPPGMDPDPATWRAANRGTEDVTWWTWHGPRMVGDFASWWNRSGLFVMTMRNDDTGEDEPLVEHEFLVQVGGVDVRAIPDAIVVDEHGQLDVLDYKSGNPAKLKDKDPYQLGVYAAATEVGLGMRPTWGLFYGTRLAEAYPHDLNRVPLSKVADDFARFDANEIAGIYKPNPGSQCKFCAFRDHCDYKESRR